MNRSVPKLWVENYWKIIVQKDKNNLISYVYNRKSSDLWFEYIKIYQILKVSVRTLKVTEEKFEQWTNNSYLEPLSLLIFRSFSYFVCKRKKIYILFSSFSAEKQLSVSSQSMCGIFFVPYSSLLFFSYFSWTTRDFTQNTNTSTRKKST